MSLRADSYGSVAEVVPLVRAFVQADTFNSTTDPTLTQVEKIIDRVSGVLNGALAMAGFTTPITNTTAKLSCDNFAVENSAMIVMGTNYGSVSSGNHEDRGPINLSGLANQFVNDMSLGFIRLGVPMAYQKSAGLSFTAEDKQSDRPDPQDSTLEQPKFRRGLFDNRTINYTDNVGDDDE